MYKLLAYILLLTTLHTVYAESETHRLYVDVFPEETHAKVFIWNIKPKFRQGIELKVGRYDLRIKAKGYHTWRKWIVIKDEDIFEQVDLTPLNQPNPMGTQDNNDIEEPSNPIIDESIQIITPTAVTPVPHPININTSMPQDNEEYILTVETIPSNAKIQFIGHDQSFEQDMLLKPSAYKIRVSRIGYMSQERTFNIINDDVQLKVILVPVMASMSALSTQSKAKPLAVKIPQNKFILDLNVKPEDAVVKILSTNQLYQPNMVLPTGKYVVKIEKEGYITRRELIEITNKNVSKTIELSPPPMCFYGQSQKMGTQGETLYSFYSVRLNFYQNFVEVHYYVQTMPLGVTSHYEFKGIRQGNHLELIGLLQYGKEQEELKTQMSLENGQLVEAINGNRQVLKSTVCN